MAAIDQEDAIPGPSSSNDRASRILVLSLGSGRHLAVPSLHNLIQAIKGAAPATTAPEDFEGSAAAVTPQDAGDNGQEASSFEYRVNGDVSTSAQQAPIHWSISNRYYDAQVHFVARSIPIQRSRPGQGSRSAARTTTGGAREGSQGSSAITAAIVPETDEELRNRARDVFAALDAPSRSSQPRGGREREASAIADADALKAIQQEASEVPAVVLVIDREQPFSVHRDMLVALSTSSDDTSLPSLSGHELDVSLVLGIPGPLANASDDVNAARRAQAQKPSEAELSELYAQEGWEYVDLISGAEADLYNDDEGDLEGDDEGGFGQDALADAEAGAAEEHGFDRVREALETHLWPGLVRKDDRASRLAEREQRLREDEAALGDGTDAPIDFGAVQSFSDFQQDSMRGAQDDDGEMQAAGAERDGPYDTKDAEDAEKTRLTALLDAVLVQLNGAQLGGTTSSGLAPANFEPGSAEITQEDEALARAFMEQIARHERESQASAGSGDAAASTSRAREELEKFLDEQAGEDWLASGAGASAGRTGQGASNGFDDDFADFVTAPTPGAPRPGASLIAGGAGGLGAEQGDPDFEFASALYSVRAQAERIRAIEDPEQRREEAARVALAFSNQLG